MNCTLIAQIAQWIEKIINQNKRNATTKAIHIAKSLKSQLNEPKLVNKYVFANALKNRQNE